MKTDVTKQTVKKEDVMDKPLELLQTFCLKEASRIASAGNYLVDILDWSQGMFENVVQPRFTLNPVPRDPFAVYPESFFTDCIAHLWSKLKVDYPHADVFMFKDRRGGYEIPADRGPCTIYRRRDLKSFTRFEQYYGIRVDYPVGYAPLSILDEF